MSDIKEQKQINNDINNENNKNDENNKNANDENNKNANDENNKNANDESTDNKTNDNNDDEDTKLVEELKKTQTEQQKKNDERITYLLNKYRSEAALHKADQIAKKEESVRNLEIERAINDKLLNDFFRLQEIYSKHMNKIKKGLLEHNKVAKRLVLVDQLLVKPKISAKDVSGLKKKKSKLYEKIRNKIENKDNNDNKESIKDKKDKIIKEDDKEHNAQEETEDGEKRKSFFKGFFGKKKKV